VRLTGYFVAVDGFLTDQAMFVPNQKYRRITFLKK
jgi:hypothetical protein